LVKFRKINFENLESYKPGKLENIEREKK